MSSSSDRPNQLSAVVKRALLTEAGQQLLEELEAEFSRTVFDENTNRMAYNAGQHDLVALLRQMTKED